MSFDPNACFPFGGMQGNGPADGEGDERRGMAEVYARDYGQAVQLLFRFDYLPQKVRRDPALLLASSYHYATDARGQGQMQEGLQMSVECRCVVFIVVFDEEDDVSRRIRQVFGSLEEVKGTQIAANNRPLSFSFLQNFPSRVIPWFDGILLSRPAVIDELPGGKDVEQPIREETLLEHVERVVEILLLPEIEEVRAGVGHQPRFGIEGVRKGCDIREPAQNLRVGSDETVIDGTKQLVAVEPASGRKDQPHSVICESLVEILDAVFDGRRVEGVAFVHMLAEGHPEAELFQSGHGQGFEFFADPRQCQAAGGRDDAHGVALVELWRKHGGHSRPFTYGITNVKDSYGVQTERAMRLDFLY